MKYIKLFENFNVGGRIGEKQWLGNPIIPDAVEYLSQNNDCEKFTDKKTYKDFLDKQHYFSASHSHCFYTEEQLKYFSKNGSKYEDKDAESSDMLFEVGHELVAVWDEKNSIGYILPKEKMK